jgi:ribosomal peptide maturation radical SAM protein 1
VDGVCWREADGTPVANAYHGLTVPAGLWPAPDYTDWFATLEASPLEGQLDPQLVWESARGCWWGERSHCTFCGLNAGSIAFRSKPGEQVYAELAEAVAKYKTPNVVMVDNIIDLSYFDTLLPALAESDWDLRLFYETKSCLTTEQVALCRAAGVLEIQPGIESLSTPVLDLMGKGARGPRQVGLLRDCESYDVAVAWNYLYGFPGEEEAHYDEVLAQLPNLVHLQPPGVVCRIAIERFAPYFENPALGFAETSPTDALGLVYDVPAEELRELAYLFDAPARGVSDEYMAAFRAAVAAWQDVYAASTFTRRSVDGAIHLRDRRAGRERDVVLTDPAEVAAYDLLTKDRTPRALATALEERGFDVDVPALLERWLADGFVFGEGGRWVALATDDDPLRVRA